MMASAKIVAVTQPVDNQSMSPNDFIAYTARVSNPANQNNTKTAPQLLKYLIRENHWSPFEMVSVTMELVTTRDISRQIIRHRSFSFQEFSQRYADPSSQEKRSTLREARLQDQKNRQNSIETNDSQLQNDWDKMQANVIQATYDAYNWAIEKGIAKEQARVVLPEGNTNTTLYMAGTLRSWIHYCDLRMGNGTQSEHQVLAEQCWHQIRQMFPDVAEAVESHHMTH